MSAIPFSPEQGHVVRDLAIVNQRGLHARASAKFVQIANEFQACVTVEKDGISVGGTSIMGLMMLAASPGCTIKVTATGPEAGEAMEALATLVAARFGEEC
ncbi:HPr family phosphocarrier protein [Aminobacter sp. HY435]|uniref:HPr family phosphocarrier protein n=1 Tax=Aminobacter sp. HY435 TaxID=2970917 RepID=UPI0022B99956|nr:HPr family phosphocarrier protein [Aminobacter sp. HY435]